SSPNSTRPSGAELARLIEAELQRDRNPSRGLAEKAYLKSDLSFLGVPLPAMRQLIKTIRRPPALDRDALLQLVRILWGRSVFELRMVAVLLLEARSEEHTSELQ